MAPAKVRRTIIGGSQKMLVYDDIESSEKLKVFESAGAGFAGPGEDVHQRLLHLELVEPGGRVRGALEA